MARGASSEGAWVLIYGAEFRLITRGNPRKKKNERREKKKKEIDRAADMEAANELYNGTAVSSADPSRSSELISFRVG